MHSCEGNEVDEGEEHFFFLAGGCFEIHVRCLWDMLTTRKLRAEQVIQAFNTQLRFHAIWRMKKQASRSSAIRLAVGAHSVMEGVQALGQLREKLKFKISQASERTRATCHCG